MALAESCAECFRCVAPLDQACRTVALGQKGQQTTFDVARAVKVIGGKHFLLQDAKHNLDLVQPRGVDRKPMNADVEAQPERANPRRELLGGMGRPVIEDQVKYPDPFAPEAGEQHPQEPLKFAEALPLKTPRQRFALCTRRPANSCTAPRRW